jgi:hypothetical protein
MIDAADLVATLTPKLQALNIDAAEFTQSDDFMIFDAYPQHAGDTYRLRLEVDVSEATLGPLEIYARVEDERGNHEDKECDHTNTPAPITQKGIDFVQTIKDGVAELAPSGPKI